jgi:hypothetical protein
MTEEGNLPPHANPCCGHVTDSATEFWRMAELELPDTGDIAICINCGAILVYSNPHRNVTRYARRIEIETLPRKIRHKLSAAQQFIRQRGWIPRDAHRRDGN